MTRDTLSGKRRKSTPVDSYFSEVKTSADETVLWFNHFEISPKPHDIIDERSMNNDNDEDTYYIKRPSKSERLGNRCDYLAFLRMSRTVLYICIFDEKLYSCTNGHVT